MAKRSVRTNVDENLVRKLQLAVSQNSASAGPEADGEAEGWESLRAQDDLQGRGDPSPPGRNRHLGQPRPLGRPSNRTTLSVPLSVGDKARKLTMAITIAESQEASLGRTLAWALELLEEDLRRRGVRVVDHPVRLRSGPRGGG